ncbi:MAG: NAD+ synthase [Pseudomonadota bacterium]
MRDSAPWTMALAQLNPLVGDVAGNTEQCIEAIRQARSQHGARLVVLPEMMLCGYPPEDLLLHAGLQQRIEHALSILMRETADLGDVACVVGFPEYTEGRLYNAAVVIDGGREIARYRKWLLPNYQVFDEKRYFTAGTDACVFELAGTRIGLTICEDVWGEAPAAAAAKAGAQCLIAMNGSPYEVGAQRRREAVVCQRARETGLPIAYVNMIGGQDELVFDGGSFVVDAAGEQIQRSAPFESVLVPVTVSAGATTTLTMSDSEPLPDEMANLYKALVFGTRDYVQKNGFPGVLLGLSGGIDSALTLTIAVDALGAEAVQAIMMPYHYTSSMSLEDAAAQANALGVAYEVISIEPIVTAALGQLQPHFEGIAADTTEENIQSRSRCLLLMAMSNKTGNMLLTTGNKSEMAVGYATLYGDMAGGFAPIKDCSKSQVFALARWRNQQTPEAPPIPDRVITRPPSAELRPDQQDSDSLPEYDVLDPILAAFIERDLSVEQIVALGFDEATVIRVLTMVRRNEYKRRQAPPGVRVSPRAFGRDWRYPITSGYQFPSPRD